MTKKKVSEAGFNSGTLTTEEGFWVMWYFIEEVYKVTHGQFDLTDILTASQPVSMTKTGTKVPADPIMAAYWNEAIDKFKEHGIPPSMKLTK